jgi:hypothetical protein
MHHLAVLLAREGDAAGARPLLERALVTQEAALGPEHPLTEESRLALEHVANSSKASIEDSP